jgi:hypothetical protein
VSGEIGEEYATALEPFDAVAVLEQRWAERAGTSGVGEADPHLVGRLAGLAAPGVSGEADGVDDLCGAVEKYLPERLSNPRLGLVVCDCDAYAPAALGWTGPANYATDVTPFCSVLRCWEDHFGIGVVALTFDALYCTVAALRRRSSPRCNRCRGTVRNALSTPGVGILLPATSLSASAFQSFAAWSSSSAVTVPCSSWVSVGGVL